MTAEAADLGLLGRLRVTTGVDVHPWEEGRALILGGVRIEHTLGLAGHSDADLVAHAVTDAVLGGAGLADIGTYFPSEDPSLEGADSMDLLRRSMELVRERGAQVISLDVVIMMQSPKLAPHRDAIAANVAAAVGVEVSQVTVRATTTDRLGFIGRGEGAGALATALTLTA